ncbi:MAG: hypothetical protein HQ546_00215 [Planctomycetes bacterium]|nr:hypothetical protein [Planctomycetota bacterium]
MGDEAGYIINEREPRMNLLGCGWNFFADVQTDTLAGWAAIFGGLAVVGIVWVIQSLHKLAVNQVKLGAMLEEILRQREDLNK